MAEGGGRILPFLLCGRVDGAARGVVGRRAAGRGGARSGRAANAGMLSREGVRQLLQQQARKGDRMWGVASFVRHRGHVVEDRRRGTWVETPPAPLQAMAAEAAAAPGGDVERG